MNYRVFHAHKTVFDIVDPVKIPSDIYYDKSPDNPKYMKCLTLYIYVQSFCHFANKGAQISETAITIPL